MCVSNIRVTNLLAILRAVRRFFVRYADHVSRSGMSRLRSGRRIGRPDCCVGAYVARFSRRMATVEWFGPWAAPRWSSGWVAFVSFMKR